jgi:hypothetical protein
VNSFCCGHNVDFIFVIFDLEGNEVCVENQMSLDELESILGAIGEGICPFCSGMVSTRVVGSKDLGGGISLITSEAIDVV